MAEYQLKYTASEIDEKLGKVDNISWNDLKDKPFYEYEQVLLEWDGDISKITEFLDTGEVKLYRIGDAFSVEDAIGSNVKRYNLEKQEYTEYVLTSDNITEDEGVWGIDYQIIVAQTNNPSSIPAGIYTLDPALIGTAILKITKEKVKTIDEKFIPKNDSKVDVFTIEYPNLLHNGEVYAVADQDNMFTHLGEKVDVIEDYFSKGGIILEKRIESDFA